MVRRKVWDQRSRDADLKKQPKLSISRAEEDTTDSSGRRKTTQFKRDSLPMQGRPQENIGRGSESTLQNHRKNNVERGLCWR